MNTESAVTLLCFYCADSAQTQTLNVLFLRFVELNSSRCYGSKRGQESAPEHEYSEPSDILKDRFFFLSSHVCRRTRQH